MGSKKSSGDTAGKPLERPKKRRKVESCDDTDGKKLNEIKCTPELDEISLQLQEERWRALEILDLVVPDEAEGPKKHVKKKKRMKKDIAKPDDVEFEGGKGLPIPSNAHTYTYTQEMEIQVHSEGEGTDESMHVRKRKRRLKSEVEKDAEKTYSVNTDLKGLFTKSSVEGFNFLVSEAEEDVPCTHEGDHASPNPESHDDSLETVTGALSATIHSQDMPHKYFFFHSCSDSPKNGLEENSFFRTKTLEELESEWPTRREAMKQSFRRRHRDALKFKK
jgi:hypothetical protein